MTAKRRAELLSAQNFAALYREEYGEEPIVFQNALRAALGLDNLPNHAGFLSGDNWMLVSNERSMQHFFRTLPDGNRRCVPRTGAL